MFCGTRPDRVTSQDHNLERTMIILLFIKIRLEKYSGLGTLALLQMKHLLLLLCVLSLVPLNPAQAKGKAQPRKPPIKINASVDVIDSVSGNSITVNKRSYSITGKTTITVDGKKAEAGALKSGMHASVTPSGLEPGAAMSITARN